MPSLSRQPSDQAAARIRPLSVLPIFVDLAGRRAVVAGSSAAACWKAELLAAAGAQVHVYAPAEPCCAELRALADAQPDAVTLHAAPWSAPHLTGAALAICDAGDEQEAAAFAAAAALQGVPCNVIDRPAHGTFQFGAIVNRSPVVVSISTSGAAPILGQAIRRRIETLLAPALADWAGLAAGIRDRIAARLAPGAERRRFWEQFADRAFGPAPGAHAEQELAALADGITLPAKAPRAGRVTLVGAGPGDAELLTLKAVRALQSADIILFDDLVSDAVLELARREAKRIQVGKRGGRPSCRQEDINALMLKLAKAGRHVVRLKSGDPMVFGRAGEEIAMLEADGIAVEVVPGISAGIALAAALRLSLTHRDHAKSVRFVTGHSRKGGLPEDVDWAAIADPSATTIFYMGGRTAGQIAARLIAHGMAAETPVAVGAALGRPEQAVRTAQLADLAHVVDRMDPTQPVVIGIGRALAPRDIAAAGSELRAAG